LKVAKKKKKITLYLLLIENCEEKKEKE